MRIDQKGKNYVEENNVRVDYTTPPAWPANVGIK